jgi:peptidoglycan hydrolase-like protein with peptidoglycan-binding domain
MRNWLWIIVGFVAFSAPEFVAADDLTRMAQEELAALGYDPGNFDGEVTTQTVVAISKFQAEHDLEVTGEVSPQLVGALRAAGKKRSQPDSGQAARPGAASPVNQAADLRARQQACLQERAAAAQAAQKKKRGFGSLLQAAARTAGRFAGADTARDVSQASRDYYDVNATAEDLSSAAKDLGLSDDDVEACRNPD